MTFLNAQNVRKALASGPGVKSVSRAAIEYVEAGVIADIERVHAVLTLTPGGKLLPPKAPEPEPEAEATPADWEPAESPYTVIEVREGKASIGASTHPANLFILDFDYMNSMVGVPEQQDKLEEFLNRLVEFDALTGYSNYKQMCEEVSMRNVELLEKASE